METFVNEIGKLLSAGQVEQAAAMVADEEERSPTRHALGEAALAMFDRDGERFLACALRAYALSPAEPVVLQYVALAHLQLGHHVEAEAFARQAVDLDEGTRSLGALGNILLGAGRPLEAAEAYKQLLERDPRSAQGQGGAATAYARAGDVPSALLHFARAFDANPGDVGPLHATLHMFADTGKLLGAIAMARLARGDGDPPGEVKVALGLVMLQLTRLLAREFPARNVVPDADELVADLVAAAAGRAPGVRVAVGRALVDCGRLDEARRISVGLDPARLAPPDRANLHYLRGLLEERVGEVAAALGEYERALASSGQRWEAACNALSLLLEEEGAAPLERIERVLAMVDVEARASAPQLVFNEAVFLDRAGRRDEARRALERVLVLTREQGELAALARQKLAER